MEVAANDPFFIVYQYIQDVVARKEAFVGALPCPSKVVGGNCLHATAFAIKAFQSILEIPASNIFDIYFPDVSSLLRIGRHFHHAAVYVKGGASVIGARGDVFFDPTSAQFGRMRGILPLYRNLIEQERGLGAARVRELFLRGYILLREEHDIPRQLGAIVSAYVSAYPDRERRIEPAQLEEIAARENFGTYDAILKRHHRQHGDEFSLENLLKVDRRIQFSTSPYGKLREPHTSADISRADRPTQISV